MFGCVVETSWEQRSKLLWEGTADGHLHVKGKVLAIDALRRLEYTALGAGLKISDVSENYPTIVHELDSNGSSTRLRVSIGNLTQSAMERPVMTRRSPLVAGHLDWKSSNNSLKIRTRRETGSAPRRASDAVAESLRSVRPSGHSVDLKPLILAQVSLRETAQNEKFYLAPMSFGTPTGFTK